MKEALNKFNEAMTDLAINAIVDDELQPHEVIGLVLNTAVTLAMTFAKGNEARRNVGDSLAADVKKLADASLRSTLSDPAKLAQIAKADGEIRLIADNEPNETAH